MDNNYLVHYGVKGMKWGVRRYQNPDGTRTRLGKLHDKTSSPEFKAKAKKGAMIAAGLLTSYATHKIINNPKVVAKGASVAAKILSNAKNAKEKVKATTEFKIASKVAKNATKVKPIIKKAGDMANNLGLKDVAAVATGGAAMIGLEKYWDSKYGPEQSKKMMTYGRQPRKKK